MTNINDWAHTQTTRVSDVYREPVTDELLQSLSVEALKFSVPEMGDLILCGDLSVTTIRTGGYNSPRLILRRVPKYEYVTDGVRRPVKAGEWFYNHFLGGMFQSDVDKPESCFLIFTRREVK